MLWTYLIETHNGEEIIGTFYEKNYKKTNEKKIRIEKVFKRKKVMNYMLNGKVIIIILTVGLIKKLMLHTN